MTKVISISTIVLTLAAGTAGNKLTGEPRKPPITFDVPPRKLVEGFDDNEIEELLRLKAVRLPVQDEPLPVAFKIPKHLPIVGNADAASLDDAGMSEAEKARAANEAAAKALIAEQEEEQKRLDEEEAERQAEANRVAAKKKQDDDAAAAANADKARAAAKTAATKSVEDAGNGAARASATRTPGSRKTKAEASADKGEGAGDGSDLV